MADEPAVSALMMLSVGMAVLLLGRRSEGQPAAPPNPHRTRRPEDPPTADRPERKTPDGTMQRAHDSSRQPSTEIRGRSHGLVVRGSADHVGSAFDAELPERRTKPAVERSDCRPADVGEDEPADACCAGKATDLQYARVAARAACKADRPGPPGGLRKHEVDACRPVREDEELWRPDNLPASSPNEEAKRRVARVDHGMRLDRQSRPIELRNSRLEAMDNTQAPDCGSSSLSASLTSQASTLTSGSAPGPPSSMTRQPAAETSNPAGR